MLYLNLTRLMKDKGIERPLLFLTQNGFTYYTGNKLLNGKAHSITTKQMEKLCTAFHCTPDDLFTWQPPQNMINAESHPLQKLKPKDDTVNITSKLRELSPQKLEEVKEFLKGL